MRDRRYGLIVLRIRWLLELFLGLLCAETNFCNLLNEASTENSYFNIHDIFDFYHLDLTYFSENNCWTFA